MTIKLKKEQLIAIQILRMTETNGKNPEAAPVDPQAPDPKECKDRAGHKLGDGVGSRSLESPDSGQWGTFESPSNDTGHDQLKDKVSRYFTDNDDDDDSSVGAMMRMQTKKHLS